MNRAVAEEFFQLRVGEKRTASFERVDYDGFLAGTVSRPLVYSERNKNCKIEFDFSPIRNYPSEGPPLLLVLALGVRTFRYRALFPSQAGYPEMRMLNDDGDARGRGARRVITTLDEVELRWAAAKLRSPLER